MTAAVRDAELVAFLQSLPAPFRHDEFTVWRYGIHDDPDTTVHVNTSRDFAVLFPQPQQDYRQYEPRFKALGLAGYRERNAVMERRFRKIAAELGGRVDVLEIGGMDGAFLRHAGTASPEIRIASLEVDANSRAARDAVEALDQFADFAEIRAAGRRFDVVCFFHVLEHVMDPAPFLAECRRVLVPGGRLIIEVPSLDDPLLTLFEVPEYEAFYFQRQHPYAYSARSLARLLEAHWFRVVRSIPHQRYGLENHLTWLGRRRPGGDETLRAMFAPMDDGYRERLEASGRADAVIVVAEPT